MFDWHQCFLKLRCNIRFLARQALPLCGDEDELESNYIQLFKLHGNEDDARMYDCLRKTEKYTAVSMENETIIVMAMQVVCEVATTFQKQHTIQ